MALYEYKGISETGGKVKGKITAESREIAINNLPKLKELTYFEQNQFDIELPENLAKFFKKGKGKVTLKALADFFEQIAFLIDSGTSIQNALNGLIQYSDKSLTPIAILIANDMKTGLSLSDSIINHPDIFSNTFGTQIAAGEATGKISEVLIDISKQLKSKVKAKSKIKSAMIYPSIIAVVTFAICWALMVFVVPQIAEISNDLTGAPLPLITQFTMAVSELLKKYSIIVLPLIGIVVYILIWAIKHPLKFKWHCFLLKIPAVKDIIIADDIMTFYRLLSFSINSGLPLLEGMKLAINAIENLKFKEELKASERQVNAEAVELSIALSESTVIKGLQLQAIGVGLSSGRLPELLVNMANEIEENLSERITRFTAFVEPVMILGIGIVIGIILLSVYLPIIGIITGI